jgi:hypothetical protein
MPRLTPWLLAGSLAATLTLAGCDRDPYRRTDVWYPTGANAANLAAMVANPADLVHGHGVSSTDSKAQRLAVERIWSDSPRGLGSATGGGGGGGGGSGSGGGGGSGSGGGDSSGGGGGMGGLGGMPGLGSGGGGGSSGSGS